MVVSWLEDAERVELTWTLRAELAHGGDETVAHPRGADDPVDEAGGARRLPGGGGTAVHGEERPAVGIFLFWGGGVGGCRLCLDLIDGLRRDGGARREVECLDGDVVRPRQVLSQRRQ